MNNEEVKRPYIWGFCRTLTWAFHTSFLLVNHMIYSSSALNSHCKYFSTVSRKILDKIRIYLLSTAKYSTLLKSWIQEIVLKINIRNVRFKLVQRQTAGTDRKYSRFQSAFIYLCIFSCKHVHLSFFLFMFCFFSVCFFYFVFSFFYFCVLL